MTSRANNVKYAYHPVPHYAAQLLVCVVFPLIWVGGLVTTYDAGMAVPDWPGTYGYNLFLYPWTTWIYGPWNLFIEHGHRLLGAAAGLVTIGLLATLYRFENRRFMCWLGVLALAFVVFQGVLGGLRVVLNARTVAMLHGCIGPAFFAYCAVLTTLTSSTWFNQGVISRADSLSRSVFFGLLLAYAQLVLGAFLRHPMDDGSPHVFRAVLLLHLLLGVGLVGHILGLVIAVHRQASQIVWLKTPAKILMALALVQIGLGLATLVMKYGWVTWLGGELFAPQYTVQAKDFWAAMIVTAHVANGSLILAHLAVLWIRCERTCGTSWFKPSDTSFSLKGVLA